jgi:hypothetical protein
MDELVCERPLGQRYPNCEGRGLPWAAVSVIRMHSVAGVEHARGDLVAVWKTALAEKLSDTDLNHITVGSSMDQRQRCHTGGSYHFGRIRASCCHD